MRILVLVYLTTFMVLPPVAGDEKEKARARRALPERLREQFDANGDGKLDSSEREAARAVFSNRRNSSGEPSRPDRRELLKRFDRNGDGKLSEGERAALRKQLARMAGNRLGGQASPADRRDLVKRFDKNGDGMLDGTEKAAARRFMQRARPELMRRFDKDVEGMLDEREKKEAQRARRDRTRRDGPPGVAESTDRPSRADRETLLKRFDKNEDGKLDGDERAAALRGFRALGSSFGASSLEP